MSDKPHLQFHQTLPGLSDKAHLIFFQTLPELSDKPHLPFLQTLSELPDKAHLFFFQTLPELSDKPHLKVESFRTTLHSILPLPIESSLKTTCIPKKKMEENPLPYHDEIILRTGMPSPNTSSAILSTFISYSPLFCAAFLFSSNVPTLYPLTLSSFRPSAVFHFFVAVSHLTFHLPPQPDSFVCFHAFLL